jgi:hypothetical protein
MQSARYSCQILIKIGLSQQIFEQYSDTKFNLNPSSGSRVIPYVQMGGRTDMTKLIVAFRNFANAPKILLSAHTRYLCVL